MIISEYTREAGVRNLERLIGTIARKIAARVAMGTAQHRPPWSRPTSSRTISGPARFKREVAFRTSRPGVATGVAWTETGGDVLFIEASLLPGGRGQFILTGQLGEVMQESARAAVSHIRANARELGVEPNFLEGRDLHVHVPAGAIPKDGPSAGVTMATAILSAARGEPVRQDVAMTGEITLSGLVLPVGGIREKALAAKRFGLQHVHPAGAQRARPEGAAGGDPQGHAVRAGRDARRGAQDRPARAAARRRPAAVCARAATNHRGVGTAIHREPA